MARLPRPVTDSRTLIHRPRPWIAGGLLSLGLTLGCTLGPEAIPGLGATDHRYGGLEEVPEEQRATLWVSYQIAVEQVDGVETDYRPAERCVYYSVTLPPGPHALRLRLDYESPTHRVHTEDSLEKKVDLEPGQAYTLLDLSAGIRRQRTFSPWLLNGAPQVEDIEWEWVSGSR